MKLLHFVKLILVNFLFTQNAAIPTLHEIKKKLHRIKLGTEGELCRIIAALLFVFLCIAFGVRCLVQYSDVIH